jgi:ComEC/Rec2-related protein
MAKLNLLLRTPLITSTVVCVFSIYSGFFHIPKYNRFLSLIPKDRIHFIKGKIAGNPVKKSGYNGEIYLVPFEVRRTESYDGKTSGSLGCIKLQISAGLVEAHYPGKLYTDTCMGENIPFIVERGNRFTLTGVFGNDVFYVHTAIPEGFDPTVSGMVSKLRAVFRIHIKRLMYAWDYAGGLLLALLSGSGEFIEDSLHTAFKNAGLAYILALSGMHLTLFSGMALFFIKPFDNKKLTNLMSLISVSFFVWLAGFSPSLLRSVLFCIIRLFFSASGIALPSMLHILSLSFLIHAAIAPSHLFNAAFLLSYGALAGILCIGKILQPVLIKFLPYDIALNTAAATGAFIFTAPVSLHLFGRIMPGGIVASIIIQPLIILFVYLGLCCIILSLCVPFLSTVLSGIILLLYKIIKATVIQLARIPSI